MFDFVRKHMLWEAWNEGFDSEIGKLPHGYALKAAQDLAVYSVLRGTRERRIGEIGAGRSRLLPALAVENDCVAIEKYQGAGNGPTEKHSIAGVKNVSAFIGERSSELADGSFDVLFSISVVEHVPTNALDGFFDDLLRILAPGGIFLHAIDLYIEDTPSKPYLRRFAAYKTWLDHPAVEPLQPVKELPLQFAGDMATHPDHMMYRWGTTAPKLDSLRQEAQVASLLVGGRRG